MAITKSSPDSPTTQSADTPVTPPSKLPVGVKYGDLIRLRSEYTSLKSEHRLLSVCGTARDGVCGHNITIRTDQDSDISWDVGKLRNWVIGGGVTGSLVKYGDVVTIQVTATKYISDLYLSPCGGGAGTSCGTAVTLRPNAVYEENQNLRNWTIDGGTKGDVVNYANAIRLRGMATEHVGHFNLYMSPCGKSVVDHCGVEITLGPENSIADRRADWTVMPGIPPPM